MSIELDWQTIGEEPQEPGELTPLPPARPRQQVLHRRWLALALLSVLIVALATAYLTWVYRARLNLVKEPVRAVAWLEAQAVTENDRASFMALQDPDDPSWRALQEKRFGRLEWAGLPEFGWPAMGVQPLPGAVSLEPGGARLDVTYQFSLTQPLPGGPTSVTLRVPQYYKQTPSGWVHAMPGADFWGRWRASSGKRFAMSYVQRDTDVLEPLIPRMDAMLEKVCGSLPCPPQPVFVVFENSPDSLSHLSDVAAFDENGFSLKFVSPHLIGLPTDARSRDELYRALETRVVQALVYEASGRELDPSDLVVQEMTRWTLSQVGLSGPFITAEITRTLAILLRTGVWQSLDAIPLHSNSRRRDATQVAVPLALDFLEQHMGAGIVARLLPAMAISEVKTLGDVLRNKLNTNPSVLEPAWQRYLRRQAGFSSADELAPPDGELALQCTANDGRIPSLWRVRTDGTSPIRITSNVSDVWPPAWSPDGKQLAYMQGDHVSVTDVDRQQTTIVEAQGLPGWLPDPQGAFGAGRLWVTNPNGNPTRLVNLDMAYTGHPGTGQNIELDGTFHTWSPDGTRVAYFAPGRVASYQPTVSSSDIKQMTLYLAPDGSVVDWDNPSIWIADAEGRNAQQIAYGAVPTWSPDGKRLAFLGNVRFDPSMGAKQTARATKIQIMDIASGAVRTLVRGDKLFQSSAGSQEWALQYLAWAPNGALYSTPMLAVGASWQRESVLVILDAETGAVRAREGGALVPRFLRAWSPDSRYVIWAVPDSFSGGKSGEVKVLNVQTGRQVTLPGSGSWGWSPDGKWLAVTQGDAGIVLVTPDLTGMHWLVEGLNCSSVVWRPGR